MRRAFVVLAALLVGLAVGLGSALAIAGGGSRGASPAMSTVAPTTTAPNRPLRATLPTRPAVPAAESGVLLAWTAGGLPAGFPEAVRALSGVRDLTVVRGDLRGLVAATDRFGQTVERVRPGWVVPLDVLAVDPRRYGVFVDRSTRLALARLGRDDVLLSETSATLRGVEAGGHLQLASGPRLTVAGVVPDTGVAGAEAVVNLATGVAAGAVTERYVLVRHRGDRAPLDRAIRSLTDEAVRTRAAGETPFLRHADAVLPQALIKARFGEFSYRGTGVGPVVLEPRWVAENIVTVDLPVLGRTTCHRALLPALRGALDELVAANLAHLVASFEGCYSPRTVAGSSQLSRHAWGAAVDVNFSVNPTGTSTVQDPRLVTVLERWGFGSGDLWLVPDSGHFEYIAPPAPG